MDVENIIPAASFRFDLVEALNSVSKVCDQNPSVQTFCARFLALEVRLIRSQPTHPLHTVTIYPSWRPFTYR